MSENEGVSTERLTMHIADSIKSVRTASGISQVALAGLLNREAGSGAYSQATVWAIESGKRRVSAVELYVLARIFDVRMDDLTGYYGPFIPLAARLRTAVEDAIKSVMGGTT